MVVLTLWDRFQECRGEGLPGIPRDELLRYMDQAANVLDLLNINKQIQYLDVKPHHLILESGEVRLAGTEISKALGGMICTVTPPGITPVYAAPETFDGRVSRFCDQYSVAVVYQEMLTGQRPFRGSSLQQLIMQHLTSAPNLTPLPPAERNVVGRALSKRPEDRYPSCGEFVRALQATRSDQ
jgi:eukaryotic-like serine/threonine-protein kinase